MLLLSCTFFYCFKFAIKFTFCVKVDDFLAGTSIIAYVYKIKQVRHDLMTTSGIIMPSPRASVIPADIQISCARIQTTDQGEVPQTFYDDIHETDNRGWRFAGVSRRLTAARVAVPHGSYNRASGLEFWRNFLYMPVHTMRHRNAPQWEFRTRYGQYLLCAGRIMLTAFYLACKRGLQLIPVNRGLRNGILLSNRASRYSPRNARYSHTRLILHLIEFLSAFCLPFNLHCDARESH